MTPINDEQLVGQIKKAGKMGNVVLQTDLCYSPSPVQERKENHPYYPHLFLLADKESGMIMDVKVYENKKEYANIVLNKLIDFFLDNGVPTKI